MAADGENEVDNLAASHARAAAGQRARADADQNLLPAPRERDIHGRYIYEGAPVPVPRMFSSPLAPRGTYAIGPRQERKVLSGWGDPRSTEYGDNANTATRHNALDYYALFGEEIYAAASGTVSFVGFQSKRGSVSVAGIHVDDVREEIYDAAGTVVASTQLNNIGFGGVAIYINHTSAEFQGYKTGYFHLSNTHVREGQHVEEGQLIGNIGTTGGYYNWWHKSVPVHLHFQIEYASGGLRAIVRPTFLVPNRWPGHVDSISADLPYGLLLPNTGPAGAMAVYAGAAARLAAFNRATHLQNQGPGAVKDAQALAGTQMAQTMDLQRSAVYAARTAFTGQAPVVTAPMTFDFTQGVWLVNYLGDGEV